MNIAISINLLPNIGLNIYLKVIFTHIERVSVC